MPSGRRPAVAAAGFGLAAALSAWNPLSAPFGLVVGLAAGALSLRALLGGGARRVASAGLGLSLIAIAVSAVVLARTAGLGREPAGEAVVPGRPQAEVAAELDAAAARTRDARERARRELEATGGAAGERRPDAAPGDRRP
jgi:hypothetical protein